jgi:dihydroorotase-like cyclic amidohydrolase
MKKPKRPGYYVEDRYYGFNIAQAQARAAHLTREYGREVHAVYVSSAGTSEPVAPARADVVPITRGKP